MPKTRYNLKTSVYFFFFLKVTWQKIVQIFKILLNQNYSLGSFKIIEKKNCYTFRKKNIQMHTIKFKR